MTAAERQAHHRTKQRQYARTAAPVHRRRPPRPQRWASAVATLLALQDEYRIWLDNLPDALDGSSTAEKLHAIVELDLEELAAIDPPRGYGCD